MSAPGRILRAQQFICAFENCIRCGQPTPRVVDQLAAGFDYIPLRVRLCHACVSARRVIPRAKELRRRGFVWSGGGWRRISESGLGDFLVLDAAEDAQPWNNFPKALWPADR